MKLFIGLIFAVTAAAVQSVSTQYPSFPGISEGLPTGLAAWVFWCWRQDKRDDAKRYEQLAQDYRAIVEQNTQAMTSLHDLLQNRPCIIERKH
jgi:hypothetical protein